MPPIQSGLEKFIANPPADLKGQRLGLLCNPASIDRKFRHARDLIMKRFPGQLTTLFSPQHGFYSEKQDNMVESEDLRDPETGLTVFSLYGHTRVPTADMFDGIDTLLIDLQDVGTRVYTFATTVSYCLEIAREMDKQVIVLDRPNPINGIQMEGNRLKRPFASFVGRYPIPMRHGLTLGEYARYINEVYRIGCRLEVIPMQGWHRHMCFSDTGLPWIPPSPNLPTATSALVYPGQVILEGTNISEGRGTTTPFEIFGAPFIEPNKIAAFMGGHQFPGGVLRTVAFEPMFHKWQHQSCRGFHLHITRPPAYNAYQTTLRLLQAVMYHHPEKFAWRNPPYEYEWEKLPIDLILGDAAIRERLERFEPLERIEAGWLADLTDFQKEINPYFLYEQ